jgi:hypothetical protein
MSFQAYLDTIEDKTGMTPRALLEVARERGFEGPQTKIAPLAAWLRQDYGVGRGHAMALLHVIKNGAGISDKHVGSTGPHRDANATLWLDGKATNPNA